MASIRHPRTESTCFGPKPRRVHRTTLTSRSCNSSSPSARHAPLTDTCRPPSSAPLMQRRLPSCPTATSMTSFIRTTSTGTSSPPTTIHASFGNSWRLSAGRSKRTRSASVSTPTAKSYGNSSAKTSSSTKPTSGSCPSTRPTSRPYTPSGARPSDRPSLSIGKRRRKPASSTLTST